MWKKHGVIPSHRTFFCNLTLRDVNVKNAVHLEDVALLNGHMLQLTGLLLQTQRCAADCKAGHHLLRDLQSTLTHLHCLYLLLETLHIGQKTLQTQEKCV